MKILKYILLTIVALIAIVLITAIFVKKEYTVEREITISKPKQEVFDYVKMMNNQSHYNKWVMRDPNAVRSVKGTDGTVGYTVAWDSKDSQVGKGEQEIKNISEGQKIDWELRFKKPFEGLANTSMTTDAAGDNQTKVKWVFNGKSNYPMNIMNLFIDGMLGKDMNASLNNLKGVLEK